MGKKRKINKLFVYKHLKLNQYLRFINLGDGEIELQFSKFLDPECILTTDWYPDNSMDSEVESMLKESGVELNDKWVECHFDDFKKIAVEIIELV